MNSTDRIHIQPNMALVAFNKKETKFAELERKANQIKTNRIPNRKDRQFESIEKELIERDVKL